MAANHEAVSAVLIENRSIALMTVASESSIRRYIRVKKEDSAFVYFILESYEGITSYSTLAYSPADAHRDLELRIPASFDPEVQDLLQRLGDLVYELEPQSSTI